VYNYALLKKVKMYTIGKFAKKLGITVHTLRVWDKENKLIFSCRMNKKIIEKLKNESTD